jgi:chromate transport protein ChrA
VDIPTALVAALSVVVLWRWKIPEPVVIGVAGLLGVGIWLASGRAS